MRPRPFPHESASYPFTDASTFRVANGAVFPRNFLLDARIYATSKGIYEISRIEKTPTDLKLTIGPAPDRSIITGSYKLLDKEEQIDLYDRYGRRAGVLVVDTAEMMSFLPDGDYELSANTAKFEVSCHVMVGGRALEGFVVETHTDIDDLANTTLELGTVTRTLMSGDLNMVGGHGVALVREGNELTIHFTGEPYYNLWESISKGFKGNNSYLTAVNLLVRNPDDPQYNLSTMIVPDEHGNIPIYMNNAILGLGDALRLRGERGRLTIRLAGKQQF